MAVEQLRPARRAPRGARLGQVVDELPGAGTPRKLGVTPDRIQSHGLDVAPALSGGTGKGAFAVMNANNGEVLALANLSDADLQKIYA